MKIADLDTEQRVLLIAEIGNNHEGDYAVAERLVREAAASGADAVKFQTFQTEHYVSHRDEDRFRRLESFRLTFEQFSSLADLARSEGLLFLSTPFDLQSADFLSTIVDGCKVSSGDNTFYPLIERVVRGGKPIVLSTGMCDLSMVRGTVEFIEGALQGDSLQERVALLHCVASYPVPPEQANLAAIGVLGRAFGCTVGYSDHTLGVEAAVTAVAAGARIIEKHFTLDKAFSDFRDHELSADPEDMRKLVDQVRQVEALLGRPTKGIQPCEADAAVPMRRSVVVVRDLPEGHRLKQDDLTWVRPGGGTAPGDESLVLGKALNRPLRKGDQVGQDDVS
jgi:N,N'-diacetyllegionaminate synthase